ncbi:hypothetical protein [Flavobacterium sp.]|uniref:hypothetical protein n=1 Tax=Flavobacterium sp. TaxID=239 RepID=UPI0026349D84|nr:hypothetical protein [Flavobacterium sp.]
MKSHFIVPFFLFFTCTLFSQNFFEKGYYVDKAGNKIDCLIKNFDWDATPNQFQIKENENSKNKYIGIEDCNEVNVPGKFKYVFATFEADEASFNLNELNYERELSLKKTSKFLKLIVEGKANLYELSNGNNKYYFYSIDSSEIKQLVYKQYFTTKTFPNISHNYRYKNQIKNDINCNLKDSNIDDLMYERADLSKVFITYNNCFKNNTNPNASINNNNVAKSDDEIVSVDNNDNKRKKIKVNYSATLGINKSNIDIKNSLNQNNSLEFDSKISPRLGLEIEFIANYNNNKWSIFIDPNYSKVNSTSTYNYTPFGGTTQSEIIDFKGSFFEIPVGIRHYMFLNNKDSKLFLNAILATTLVSVSDVKSTISDDIDYTKFKTRYFGFGFGFGFAYKKLSSELRYDTTNDLDEYINYKTNYGKLALIFKYKLN